METSLDESLKTNKAGANLMLKHSQYFSGLTRYFQTMPRNTGSLTLPDKEAVNVLVW